MAVSLKSICYIKKTTLFSEAEMWIWVVDEGLNMRIYHLNHKPSFWQIKSAEIVQLILNNWTDFFGLCKQKQI